MTLEELFAKNLRVPVSVINDSTAPKVLRNWDSMAHLELVTVIEKAYGVKFSTPEILAMSSVGRIREMLREKGKTV